MASPIPATAPVVLEFRPPKKHPEIIKKVTTRSPNQNQFKPNQSWQAPWGLLGELLGPKTPQAPKSTKTETEKCEMVDARGPHICNCLMIFASFGC